MKYLFRRQLRRLAGPFREALAENDLVNSIAPQQLVTKLIDKSSSMDGLPIQQVNQGAASFARELSADILTRDSVQVQLVTFGDTVQVYPFVPISRFVAPTLKASGATPMAEAILQAIAETKRYARLLQAAAEVDVPTPLFFLFSDGQPTSPSRLLAEAAALIAESERTRQGAFYAFGVDQHAVQALQPLFPRQVYLLGERNFADFFRIISASVCRVSSMSVSEDIDLTPFIKNLLHSPSARNDDA